jgi:hypothetical protein
MLSLTENERKALLTLLKDFSSFHNANSLSKTLGISHVGSQKILKRFAAENLIVQQKIGKAIINRLKLDNDLVIKLMEYILADEANMHKRWMEEFKDLGSKDRIVMLFGSTIRDYSTARDIDLMLIINKDEHAIVRELLARKQEILPKMLHTIELTREELISNIRQKKGRILDIVRNAVILYGQNRFLEVMKDVAGAK